MPRHHVRKTPPSAFTLDKWRPIPGLEGYEISEGGRVRSYWYNTFGQSSKLRAVPRDVRQTIHPTGYALIHLRVALGTYKTFRVHRLVLEAFVGPCPPGMEACHNDDNKRNNHISNLRWDSRKSNLRDMVLHGRIHKAKLVASDIPAVRSRLAAGESQTKIAADYGVNQTTISCIHLGKTWTCVA